MNEQQEFIFKEAETSQITRTIKGYPELHWTGKRPFKSTQYFPAQLKEQYGQAKDGWMNKIFWGDNLQVMSHLLKEYRGKVDLIYIDPPFESAEDYKKKIEIRGKRIVNDTNAFEEKQYTDIWLNDEYLQFMYERLILMRELLSESGSIYLHCDWHKSHHLRCIMEEVFGKENFKSEIIWKKSTKTTSFRNFASEHDTIFYFVKNNNKQVFNQSFTKIKESELKSKYIYLEKENGEIVKLTKEEKEGNKEIPKGRRFRGIPLLNMNQDRPNLKYEFLGFTKVWATKKENMLKMYEDGLIFQIDGGMPQKKGYLDEVNGVKVNDMWIDINPINSQAKEKENYPTQKPEELLKRIINSSTNQGDLIFDCFMGSGTTQSVAMKLGRRFIGADINLGAIQTTTKRLINIANNGSEDDDNYYGFEVYNVNNYDFFRNEVEAKELLIEALEVQKIDNNNVYDGEKDGRMIKILPVNRIATKADLSELLANLPYKTFEKRKEESPNDFVEKMTLVCMGHEPDLKSSLEQELRDYKIDIEIVDILRDKSMLELKREAEANIVIENNKLKIESFYPMNLLQKMSIMKEKVEDWKTLVESIMIDWNYDGVIMQPTTIDIPDKNQLVVGIYDIPEDAGKIKVKITDVLSESLEMEVQ